MPAYTCTYSIANDTANGTVRPDLLQQEFIAAGLGAMSPQVSTSGDVLTVDCAYEPSQGELTAMGVVVAAHLGTATPHLATSVAIYNASGALRYLKLSALDILEVDTTP